MYGNSKNHDKKECRFFVNLDFLTSLNGAKVNTAPMANNYSLFIINQLATNLSETLGTPKSKKKHERHIRELQVF